LDIHGTASGSFVIMSCVGSGGGTARDIVFKHGGSITTGGGATDGTTVATVKSTGLACALGFTPGVTTVGALPAASGVSYMIYVVTDSLAPVLSATVAAGGSAKATVQSNGTNWIVIAVL
jgi:hypothetical protein